jgi:hypothetical protein
MLTTGTAIVLCLAVSACAGTGGASGIAKRSNPDADVDVGKVIAVNDWALRRHASVVWVNYPKKPAHLKGDG